jgi:hypothetical protein
MFFLLTISTAILILPFVIKKCRGRTDCHDYEQLSVSAVWDNKEHHISSPDDLTEEVDFFIITYARGDCLHKVCRHSVTVPQHLKRATPTRSCLISAIVVDDLGNVRDVTQIVRDYAGPFSNFSGNDLSLIEILNYHGVKEVSFVITSSRNATFESFLEDSKVDLHTNINITKLF